MKTLSKILTLKLMKAGVVAGIEVVPGEGGGVNVRVARIGDIAPAEAVAAEVVTAYGVEVLVCF